MLDPGLAAVVGQVAHGHVLQAEPVAELMSGAYDAITTVGEFFSGSVLGLGVAEACDGEVVSVAGQTWRIPADGYPILASADVGLAFAVRASGGDPIRVPINAPTDWSGLDECIGEFAEDAAVVAVRIDGDFKDVLLRSEVRQKPPYRPLAEVLANEVRFPFAQWTGTMVGFRFPSADEVVPGFHLHAVSHDHTSGGHCHDATVVAGELTVWLDDVHLGLEYQRD
jgi:acetolactate decarboxylase